MFIKNLRSLVFQQFQFSSLVMREQHDKISIITLNNEKKRNPLSLDCLKQLSDALLQTQEQNIKTKVIIIRAKGPVFSAGHDLKELITKTSEEAAIIFDTLGKICLTIRNLPQPVIAQVEGLATAGGCQLALACDLVTATNKASFQTPGLYVGLFCTTPGVELIRSLPNTKIAMEMLLLGKPITAGQALQYGLINRVFDYSEINERTLEFAQEICKFSGESIGLGKKTFYQQANMQQVKQAYDLASKSMCQNLQFEDTKEGINAFIEKRSPQFKN